MPRNRLKDRHTDRQTDRQTRRQTDRQTDTTRLPDKQTDKRACAFLARPAPASNSTRFHAVASGASPQPIQSNPIPTISCDAQPTDLPRQEASHSEECAEGSHSQQNEYAESGGCHCSQLSPRKQHGRLWAWAWVCQAVEARRQSANRPRTDWLRRQTVILEAKKPGVLDMKTLTQGGPGTPEAETVVAEPLCRTPLAAWL